MFYLHRLDTTTHQTDEEETKRNGSRDLLKVDPCTTRSVLVVVVRNRRLDAVVLANG